MMPKRNERIAFRVVTRATAARDIVTSCAETTHKAINVVSGFGYKVNNVSVQNPKPSHVGFMHENDFARAVYSTQAILVAIDRGVELIVATHCDQGEHAVSAFGQVRIFGEAIWHNEIGLAVLRLPNALSCRKRTVESPRIGDPRIPAQKWEPTIQILEPGGGLDGTRYADMFRAR